MKRIILLCCLALASCTAVTAQTNPPTVNPQTDPKTLFASNVNEYEAGIMRSNNTLAQKGFSGAMTMIGNSISQLQQQINTTPPPANVAALTAKLQTQQQLQTDLQALQSNIMGNATQISNKFAAFKASM